MRAVVETHPTIVAGGELGPVLDLGCGDGAMLAYLQQVRGCTGYGIEIDEANVLACVKRGVNVIQLEVLKLFTVFRDCTNKSLIEFE